MYYKEPEKLTPILFYNCKSALQNPFVYQQNQDFYTTYTYEENTVIYCASATQKGVYCYTYCLNNPLKYTDPTGEYAIIDDVIAGLIGGVVNLGVNIYQGNLSGMGFWETLGKGAAAFGSGAGAGVMALYGPAGWAAGGALVGGTNAWLSGGSGSDIAMGVGVGAFSGLVGGAAGSWASQGLGGVVINGFSITSPVVKGLVGGAIGGAAGGYAGGFTGGLMMSGGDLRAANKAGMSGLTSGLVIGSITGSMGAYRSAKNAGINPWSGKANNSVTIGEGMYQRVNPAARDLNSGTIDGMPDAYFGKEINSTYTTRDAMNFNANWVESQMQQGNYIYDIGPRGANINSPYYNMEVGRTMLYPNVINTNYFQYGPFRIIITH